MAELVVQSTEDTSAVSFVPADAGGDWFLNDGTVSLTIIGPVAAFSVEILNGRDCSYNSHPNYEIVIPADSIGATSPRFDPRRFNNAAGQVHITYPDAVGIQVAAVKAHQIFTDPEA
jgi:hypothetical protein